MRYSFDVEVKSEGFYGPYDLYIGGTWVARREYDGSDYPEMIGEFIESLGQLVANKPLWSAVKPAEEDE